MSKRCPFLETNPFSLFGASYHCVKTDKDVSDGSELYKQYCEAHEDAYKECPFFKNKK